MPADEARERDLGAFRGCIVGLTLTAGLAATIAAPLAWLASVLAGAR